MGLINPIETLAMAPKSLTTSIHNVNRIQKEEMMQAQTAEAFKTEIKRNNELTIETQKSEYKEYRYDKRDETKHGSGQKRGRDPKQEEVIDEDDKAAMLGDST